MKKWKKTLNTILLSSLILSCYSTTQAKEHTLDSFVLDKVIVEGYTTYGGMFGDTGYMGNMLNTKNIMDIPVETTSIGNEGLKTFSIPGNELYDALTISPSIRQSTSSVGLRGFYTTSDAMSINGVSGMVEDSSISTNFLEKIDILSGPNIVYSGSNSNSSRPNSGGSIILQAKKARMSPQNNIDIKYTSKNTFTESIDFGRRFGNNNTWGIRINSMNRNGQSSIHNEKKPLKNIYINIDNISRKSSSNLLIGYENKKTFGGIDYWRPQQGNNSSTAIIPSVPNGKYNQLPKWIHKHTKNTLLIFNHDQKFNDNFSTFFNAGYRKTNTPINISGSMNNPLIFDQNGKFNGDFKFTNVKVKASKDEKFYFGAGLRFNNEFKNIKNELVIGVDRSQYKGWSGKSQNVTPKNFIGNIYDYNDWPEPQYTIDKNLILNSKRYVTSISAIDTIKLFNDKLILIAGLHHHQYQPYNITNKNISKEESYSATCPTYGIVYKFTPNFMFYSNHSEDFQRGKIVDDEYANAGELLTPDITKSNELGLKYINKKFLHTLSLFRMNDTEYMVNDNNYYTKEGRTIYKGGVYSIAGSFKKLDLFGGIGYSRRIWDKSDNKNLVGLDADGIPKWNASLGTIYHANSTFDILGRILYTGKANIYSGRLTVPSSTRVDLGFKYKYNLNNVPFTITAMCFNVFDKKYWITANQGNQIKASTPRTFMLSANFEI